MKLDGCSVSYFPFIVASLMGSPPTSTTLLHRSIAL